jgi:hypothetical protein
MLKPRPTAFGALMSAPVISPVRSGERWCGASRDGRSSVDPAW